MQRSGLVAAVALALAVSGCSGSGSAEGSSSSSSSTGSTPAGSASGTAQQDTAQTASPGGVGTPSEPAVCRGRSIPQMVSQVEPSVVTIRTTQGLGSGIVYRPDVVLTDEHVVARQEGSPQTFSQVKVLLADGSTLSGKVIGSDLLTDLAAVRVKRNNLPPATFAKGLPRPGATVLAIGSPLGFSSTVTKGIVSALNRDLPSGSSGAPPLVDLVQTDAPISPGNSGGALVDVCGRVVGVNEAYIPPSSGAVSLGFATPSVVATDIADQLISSGQAQHPFLGVSTTELTPQIAQALHTSADSGVVVTQVTGGAPAATAGVRRGDVITALDGQRIATFADLLGALRTTHPGNTVKLRVDRSGKTMTIPVTVGSRTEPNG